MADRPPTLRARRLFVAGLLTAAAFTLLYGLTAGWLSRFAIVGPTVPFQYPWRLLEPSATSRLSAWSSYVLHQVAVWWVIAQARRERPDLRRPHRHTRALLIIHGSFALLHWLQSQLFYDGLAQDVPELTALGSVALMLMVVLVLEMPRRGLLWGRGRRVPTPLREAVRNYHGYLFSWAIVYTFWYHPAEGTAGHLFGFFYMFLLLWQATVIFTPLHVNRWWTLLLELLVLPHGVAVAVLQGNGMWPMFGFGFGAVFVLTQLHGLGWRAWQRWAIAAGFVVSALVSYTLLGRLSQIHEISRIPVLDYAVVGLLLGVGWLVARLRPTTTA